MDPAIIWTRVQVGSAAAAQELRSLCSWDLPSPLSYVSVSISGFYLSFFPGFLLALKEPALQNPLRMHVSSKFSETLRIRQLEAAHKVSNHVTVLVTLTVAGFSPT